MKKLEEKMKTKEDRWKQKIAIIYRLKLKYWKTKLKETRSTYEQQGGNDGQCKDRVYEYGSKKGQL